MSAASTIPTCCPRRCGSAGPRSSLLAFDTLYVDGHGLRRCAIEDRKALLRDLVCAAGCDHIVSVDYMAGRGAASSIRCSGPGAEGIVVEARRPSVIRSRQKAAVAAARPVTRRRHEKAPGLAGWRPRRQDDPLVATIREVLKQSSTSVTSRQPDFVMSDISRPPDGAMETAGVVTLSTKTMPE